ncbi:MAG TPA: type II toxin-antitoxin system VapC family toxin [Verrucomicrobiae bacterium]
MIVVDVNLVAHLTIKGQFSPLAEAAFAADSAWAAPLLWLSEFRNTLAKYIQHRDMSTESALLSLRSAEEIIGGRAYNVSSERVLELAQASGCSAYDCEYVALAQDLGVPLVTTDKQILRAFPKIAVSLEKFARNN